MDGWMRLFKSVKPSLINNCSNVKCGISFPVAFRRHYRNKKDDDDDGNEREFFWIWNDINISCIIWSCKTATRFLCRQASQRRKCRKDSKGRMKRIKFSHWFRYKFSCFKNTRKNDWLSVSLMKLHA